MADKTNDEILRQIVRQADEKLAAWRPIFGADGAEPLAVQIDWALIEAARAVLSPRQEAALETLDDALLSCRQEARA